MSNLLNKGWLLALSLFPLLLWVLPASFLDKTGFELCPSKFFFDIECFGCGITRAVMHLHHFDWREALYYNSLVVLVYPALVGIWIIWWRAAWRKVRKTGQTSEGISAHAKNVFSAD